MTALFVGSIDLNKVKNFLFDNDINFEKWYRDDKLEIRVDLKSLDEDEFNKIESEFNSEIGQDLNKFTYLIFWK